MHIRKMNFSGSWYPKTSTSCIKEISNYLNEITIKDLLNRSWIGGIVPHAGWYFSGNIACNVIRCLASEPLPDVIVIFGMHLHSNSSSYILLDGEIETPLGNLIIDSELSNALYNKFPNKFLPYSNQINDNTIELQLPFIKYFFKETKILPIGIAPSSDAIEIGKSVAELSSGLNKKIKFIGSTDLTHYGINYGFYPKGLDNSSIDWVRKVNDQKIIEKITNFSTSEIISEASENLNACCPGSVTACIAAVLQSGANFSKVIAYANSYDKNPGNSFVGYVGILFGL